MTTISGVAAVAVFHSSPGIPAEIGVLSEHGDVVLLVELTGCAFCALVMTATAAIDLSLLLSATIMDARHQQGGAP